jgi:hypothetical protein
MPGFVDYVVAMSRLNRAIVDVDLQVDRQTHLGGFTLVFWSIYACAAYLLFFACAAVTWVMPKAFLMIHQRLAGRMAKKADLIVDYLLDVHQ